MIRRFLPLLSVLCLVWSGAQANDEVQISELSWMDRNHMQQQADSIEKLVQTRFGSRLRGDKSDLGTLQRIVDQGIIDRNDKLRLQALGVILGNVMEAEVAQLEWKIYEDDKGRSRALCVRGTEECLFPVTMLSRRLEVGLSPDVNKIYTEALALIQPLLPEMPYTGTGYR